MEQHEADVAGTVPRSIRHRSVDVFGADGRKVEDHRRSAYPPAGGRLFGNVREPLHKTSIPSELYFFSLSPYHDFRTAVAFAHGAPRPSARFVTNLGTTPSSRRPATLRAVAERLRGGG